MIFDIICGILLLAGLVTGFKDGLIKTLLKGAFFIAGGLVGMHLVLERNQSVWLILAMIVGAYIGSFIGLLIAKSLKLLVIRGPLRLIDNLLGAAFEVTKYLVFLFVVGSVLTLTGPDRARSDVKQSKVFTEMNNYAPLIILDVKSEIESKVKINPLA